MLHLLKNPSVVEYAVGTQKKKLNLNLKSSLSEISISSISTEQEGMGRNYLLGDKGIFTHPVNHIPHVDMYQLTLALEITSSFHLRLQIVCVGRFLSCQIKQEYFFLPSSKNIWRPTHSLCNFPSLIQNKKATSWVSDCCLKFSVKALKKEFWNVLIFETRVSWILRHQ